MSVPHYGDFGKPTNDLLSKDFPIGQFKLDVKSTATDGKVQFNVLGHQDIKTGSIFGELKTKFTDKPNGLVLTQGWTTANALTTKVEITDRVTQGVKLELNGSLLPTSGNKSGRFGLEYKQPGVHARSVVDLLKGPTVVSDVVVGRDGYLVGAEIGYDATDGRITRYNTCAGMYGKDYLMTMHMLGSMSVFQVGFHHRAAPGAEVAAKALWDTRNAANQEKGHSSIVSLELGTKFTLDNNAFLKAKIDNSGKVTLGYTQVMRPGFKVSLGGQFVTNKLGENVHKVGMSFVVEN